MTLEKLIQKWKTDADQYQAQVDVARSKGLPNEQMTAGATFLRGCARELEDAIREGDKAKEIQQSATMQPN